MHRIILLALATDTNRSAERIMNTYHDVRGWKDVIHHAITCNCEVCQRFDEDCRAAGVMTVVESVRERNRLYPYSLTSVPADSPTSAAASDSAQPVR